MSEQTEQPLAVYKAINAVKGIVSKKCRRCKVVKQESELKKDRRNGDGFSSFCRDCHRESTKEWQRNNRSKIKIWRKGWYSKNKNRVNKRRKERYTPEAAERVRNFNLFRNYKITAEQYKTLWLLQEGKCAICNRKEDEFQKKLAVDHDHKCCKRTPACGKCNRGLLCHHCNTSLHALENIDGWIEKAQEYIKNHE